MKYKNSIDFQDGEWDNLIDKFIEKHKEEFEEFVEDEFQSALENDFIIDDLLYDEWKESKMFKEKENGTK
jgi:hypothetical protein